jgi:lipid-binding SYLF domain-containing protein
MKHPTLLTAVVLVLGAATTLLPNSARAASAAQIDQSVTSGLSELYASSPAARTVSKKAKAILVFPSIVKGGFMVGGQHGDGALRVGGKTVGYYKTVAVSYGFQAGLQKVRLRHVLYDRRGAKLFAQERRLGGWICPEPGCGGYRHRKIA